MSSCKLDVVKVDKGSPYYSEVKEVFRCRKEIYGDQKLSFEKIKSGDDRHCEVFVDERNRPTSILVYKLKPVKKFEDFPIFDSLEVKTFMLIDPKNVDVEETFSVMLKRVSSLAKELMASSVHMTVSAKEPWTLQFLLAHEFEVKIAWNGKYIDGVRESLVRLKLPKPVIDRPEAKTTVSKKPVDDDERYIADRERAGHSNYASRGDGREAMLRELDRRNPANNERGSYKRKRDDHDDRYPRDNKRQFHDHKGPKTCTLKRIYIKQIIDKKKTVEGRLAGGMFDKWKDGDEVKFHCFGQDEVLCKITKKILYKSFREMLEAEGVSKCIPECSNNLERAVGMYLQIPRYREKEKNGVYAFRLEVIDYKSK
ncbi:hypothetical protein CHUAL_003484 [Chamberlinius hualienensis]